jgi:hypothetical protein
LCVLSGCETVSIRLRIHEEENANNVVYWDTRCLCHGAPLANALQSPSIPNWLIRAMERSEAGHLIDDAMLHFIMQERRWVRNTIWKRTQMRLDMGAKTPDPGRSEARQLGPCHNGKAAYFA